MLLIPHQICFFSNLAISLENSSLNYSERNPRVIFNSFLPLIPHPVFQLFLQDMSQGIHLTNLILRQDRSILFKSVSLVFGHSVTIMSCHTLIRTYLWLTHKIQTPNSEWLPLSSLTIYCLIRLHFTDLHH